jgi:hypothetical protein
MDRSPSLTKPALSDVEARVRGDFPKCSLKKIPLLPPVTKGEQNYLGQLRKRKSSSVGTGESFAFPK